MTWANTLPAVSAACAIGWIGWVSVSTIGLHSKVDQIITLIA